MSEVNRPEKGIKGFTSKEWVEPEKVLPDVPRSELPEGVRFYLKGESFDLSKKKMVVNLYELRDQPGDLKVDKVHIEKLNFIPDEEYIGLNYGPNKDGYIWIGKWKDEGGEKGMVSETIVLSEKWRRRYEEHQRKLGDVSGGAGAGEVATVGAPASEAGIAMQMLKMLQAGEDRAFLQMERMAKIFQGSKTETPAEVLLAMHKGMNDMMLESVKTSLNITKTVGKAAQESITVAAEASQGGDDQVEPGPELGYKMPPWLEPFMPHLERGLEKLLGGGPAGAAVKTLILTSDEWGQIFNDPDKWGQAVAAMETKFGSVPTQKALDILLNKRKPKK